MRAATRTILGVILSWIAAVAATFVLLRTMPGDPVAIFLDRANVQASADVVTTYRMAWGLDGSLPWQFISWLKSFLSGTWGLSFETGRPVATDLAARLPWSLAIGVGGLCGAMLLGGLLGYRAALRPGGVADTVSRGFAIGGQAIPAFAVGLVALWLLAAEFRVISPFSGGTIERLILPILLVTAFSTGAVARLVRVGFAEVRGSDFYRTALAKGHSPARALWEHGRRHAGLVLVSGIAPDIAWIVGGTAIAEIVFSVPGISERVIQAIAARDYPVLQAYVALVALWIVIGLKGAALARRLMDPRLS